MFLCPLFAWCLPPVLDSRPDTLAKSPENTSLRRKFDVPPAPGHKQYCEIEGVRYECGQLYDKVLTQRNNHQHRRYTEGQGVAFIEFRPLLVRIAVHIRSQNGRDEGRDEAAGVDCEVEQREELLARHGLNLISESTIRL